MRHSRSYEFLPKICNKILVQDNTIILYREWMSNEREYIKQEMIIFATISDNDTQSKHNNNIKSAKRRPGETNQALRIIQQYYDEEEYEQDDLPTTTTAIHQTEIDNYLKFGIDK
ncbi:unnamed protein product [Rotaria magnacalcarata]|uniref:Uncharacterized protein n=1 Tax=Rotaria magnacalcarata TaxID=392030 RepID=A0A816THE1_9BILA|nr:unnamed protein product [Rotaria magnacalcarata]